MSSKVIRAVLTDPHASNPKHALDRIILFGEDGKPILPSTLLNSATGSESPVGFRIPNPIDSSKPGFRLRVHKGDFSPQPNLDPVITLGYNVADSGPAFNRDPLQKEVAGHQSAGWNLEGDYQRPDGVRQIETYPWMQTPNSEVNIRPFQIYAECWNANGTPVTTREGLLKNFSFTGPKGGFTFWNVNNAGDTQTMRLSEGTMTLYGSANVVSCQLQLGADPGSGISATQPCSLDMGFGGTPSVYRIDTQNATQARTSIAGTTTFRFFKIDAAFVATSLNANRNDFSLAIGPNPNTPSYGLLVLKRSAALTAPMIKLEESTGVILSQFNYAGYFMTRKNTAPADVDIASGEMALWFDTTNGAPKAMARAKQADGTAVTFLMSRYTGAGSPEGVVTAPVGAIYTRTDGGPATTLYVKESGAGNTGWAAK